jgi:hypothetical protein
MSCHMIQKYLLAPKVIKSKKKITMSNTRTEQSRPPTRLYHDSLSAFISGSITVLVTQPLDTIKTRFQVQAIHQSSQMRANLMKGTFSTLATIFQKEGYRTLYRGLPPSLLSISLSMAIYFPMYQYARERISEWMEKSKDHPLVIWPSVFTGWFVASSVQCPLSLLRVRLQTSNEHKGMIKTLQNIIRKEGFLALYQGYQGHAIATVFFALYFSIYEPLKMYLSETTGLPIVYISPIASGSSHLIACLATYPNDLILSRLQYQRSNHRQYNGYADAISKIVRAEGYKGLYTGLNAVLIRYSIGEITRMTLYELGLHLLRQ